ncbi:hypothetical protein C8R45DRAFT_947184 [Mycena sanguinolenta]|nr:hypothetical protein C8R45DRAFT_947184 [Mycena sanguinolenta]
MHLCWTVHHPNDDSTEIEDFPPIQALWFLAQPKTAAAKSKAKKTTTESQLEQLIRKQKETEKLLAKANQKRLFFPLLVSVLTKRNKDMLEDEDEDAQASVPAKKKARQTPALSSDSFRQDDTEALSGLFGSDRTIVEDKDTILIPDSDDGAGESEKEDNNMDEPLDAKMIIDSDAPAVKTPKKPTPSRKGSVARVTQATFSPMSVRFQRRKDGFPNNHAEFAWDAIMKAVESIDVLELADRLEKAKGVGERHTHLVTYAWGGARQLCGEVKTLCKSAVKLFGIPGAYTPAEIIKHVRFLTVKKGIFKFGGINLKDETYDMQQPFSASFYQDVISKQWFDTIKSEGVRTASFARYVDSPVPILTLVTDAMENALKEWATGVRIGIKFTEAEFGPRYQHYRTALLNLQAKSPTWFSQFQCGLYTKIISTLNFPHLKAIIAEPDEDELEGVDFEALEASATRINKSDAVAPAGDAPT